MIDFGLRLTLRGGREAGVRLAVTAAAVTLGVGLLLAILAAVNGVTTQNARYAWLNSGIAEATAPGAPATPDPAWATLGTDHYAGRTITRVDVAATGPRGPVPPGVPRLPGPGQYYVSPALSRLLAGAPASELGDRFPGRRLGTIGAAGLPGPNFLVAIVGHTPGELSSVPGVARITTIATRTPGDCPNCTTGIRPDGVDLILGVTAVALLFPILIFIATATRLSAARREQRFATMRLLGATPRQVAVVSAVESTVGALIGTVLGFGLFFAARVPLSTVAITGERFYPGDLSLTGLDVALVAVGVPLGAAIAARLALRRVRISPLGVSRRAAPPAPRAYRLIPLAAGIGELTWFLGRRPATTGGQTLAYLTGIFLMMAGLVIAGTWLTMIGSRLMVGRANRPATLIAGRRLADDPRAGFRAINGLVLALFVTSTAVGVITTMVADAGSRHREPAAQDTLMADYSGGWTSVLGVPRTSVRSVPERSLATLRATPGIRQVMVIHTDPLGSTVELGGPPTVAGLVSCRELAGVASFGRCPAGAQTASIAPNFFEDTDSVPPLYAAQGWPAAAISPARLATLPVQMIVVRTAGSGPVIERARTALDRAVPYRSSAVTVAENTANEDSAKLLASYQQLAGVVVLVSLGIAGCSLAASVVGGLNDRRRPFSLLRLTGVPLSLLRRVVILESAVPLLVVAVVASGAGFLAAGLFLKSQLHYTLRPPGAGYYLTVAVGLIASLAVIASTLPVLNRLTGPATVRNE